MIVLERRASTVLHHLVRAAAPGRFLLPANVCTVVPLTLRKAGRSFELVDVEPGSLMIDATRCLEAVAADPDGAAGVILVRTYGAPADFTALSRQLRELRPDLLLVDDACLSRPPETLADDLDDLGGVDVRLWSTGHAKYVDLGTGGYAELTAGTSYSPVTLPFDDAALEELDAGVKAAVARRSWFDGGEGDWLDTRPPEDSWQAHHDRVVGVLPAVDAHKRELTAIYDELLPAGVALPAAFNTWRHHVLVREPGLLCDALFAAGVFASRHYAPLGGVLGSGDFPVARRLHDHVVNLFNDSYFTAAQAEVAAEVVSRHVDRHGPANIDELGAGNPAPAPAERGPLA